MNKEDYFKYYIQGSDHYLIPKDVFMELFNEMINWKEESQKQKEVIDKAIEYIKENCAQSYCLPPKIYDVRCLDLNALLEILEYKEVE